MQADELAEWRLKYERELVALADTTSQQQAQLRRHVTELEATNTRLALELEQAVSSGAAAAEAAQQREALLSLQLQEAATTADGLQAAKEQLCCQRDELQHKLGASEAAAATSLARCVAWAGGHVL